MPRSGPAHDVVFVTFARAPELDSDETQLGEACTRLGLRWRAVPWDDPSFDWSSTKLAVIRSTWDYSRRRDEFLAWCERAAMATTLCNPLAVLRRNTEKSYLLDLAARGVPTIPTMLHEPCVFADPDDLMRARGWNEAVFKPTVSAGGWRTYRLRRGDRSHDRVRVKRLLSTTRCLVQPFLPSVLGSGERALVYLGSELSHAIRKRSIFDATDAAFRTLVEPEPDEIALAEKALAAEGARDLLYARVDVVRDDAGAPRLIELELTEPRLFLAAAGAEAAERLARAIARKLGAIA